MVGAPSWFGDAGNERLATLSIVHLYNLRQSKTYQQQRSTAHKTHSAPVTIGERHKPAPRVAPALCGSTSSIKVTETTSKGYTTSTWSDEVTQFQFVGSVERIAERYLLPLLSNPHRGIYLRRAGLSRRQRLRVHHPPPRRPAKETAGAEEFTKCRARNTNNNALVESKIGAVLHKHLDYVRTPGRFASAVNAFTQGVLSPYLNFHRPCFFPTEEVDAKGRRASATAMIS